MSLHSTRALYGIFAIAWLALSIPGGKCEELTSILNVWDGRQTASVGVVVEWKEAHEQPDIDWLRKHKDDPDISAIVKDGKLPVIKYEFRKRLLITDDFYRYHFKGEKPIEGIVEPQDADVAFDGSKRVVYAAAYKRGRGPAANIYGAKEPMPPNSTYLPVVLCARPFDTRLGGFAKNSISARESREAIHGVSCAVVQSRDPKSGTTYTAWLDSAHEFVPLRISRHNGEEQAFQLDIEYDRAGGRNCPSGWRLVENKFGGAGRAITSAKVTAWKSNASLGAADFRIDMPVGTAVSDFSGDNEQNYIIQPSPKESGR